MTASASSGAGSFVLGSRTSSMREHRTETTDVADLRPARLPGEHARPHSVAEDLRAARDELLLLEDVEHRARCRQRDRDCR